MNIIKGGVTAAKGFKLPDVKHRLNIRTERKIWHLYTVRSHVLQQEHYN